MTIADSCEATDHSRYAFILSEREVSDSGLDSCCCWSDDDPMLGPAPVILQAEATHVWAAARHGQGDVTLTPTTMSVGQILMIMIPSVVWIKKASQHKLRYDAWVGGGWLDQ